MDLSQLTPQARALFDRNDLFPAKPGSGSTLASRRPVRSLNSKRRRGPSDLLSIPVYTLIPPVIPIRRPDLSPTWAAYDDRTNGSYHSRFAWYHSMNSPTPSAIVREGS